MDDDRKGWIYLTKKASRQEDFKATSVARQPTSDIYECMAWLQCYHPKATMRVKTR